MLGLVEDKEATIVTLAATEEIRVLEGMIRVLPICPRTIERAASWHLCHRDQT
ncbi:MAG TPA: hypothetical protein VHT91_43535 [Kofleriaceae bacterium]|nr:hypothetical protein [Kofleriaceae bacterium]